MRIETKLCHISENKAVVKVNGWLNEESLGSALAEGSTVEVAEDNAIARLVKRLETKIKNDSDTDQTYENKIESQSNVVLTKKEKIENIDIIQEPSDWSNELTAIDSEIKRLNWSRDDEITFMEKTLGYNNRNRITKYDELINYLNILKDIDNHNSNNIKNTRVITLIEESDNILKELSWDNRKGREFLQKEFNVSTRMELDEKQLTSFLEKLKSIRNHYLSKDDFSK